MMSPPERVFPERVVHAKSRQANVNFFVNFLTR